MSPGNERGRPHDDSSRSLHSQNGNADGTVAEGYEGERYGRISLRLHDALELGDIALDEFAILCWLEGRANYNESPPRVIRTLAGIMEAVSWEKSDEALRQKLSKLAELGLIEYEVRPNGKRPYVIYLTGCRVILDATWRQLGGRLVDSAKLTEPSQRSKADGQRENSPSSHQVEESPIEHRALEQRARDKIQDHRAQSETLEQTGNTLELNDSEGFVNKQGSGKGTEVEGETDALGNLRSSLGETMEAAHSRWQSAGGQS